MVDTLIDINVTRVNDDVKFHTYGRRYEEERMKSKWDDGYLDDEYIEYCKGLVDKFVENHPEHSALVFK